VNINTVRTVTVDGRLYAAGGDPGGTMRAAWRVAAFARTGGLCACCGLPTRLDGRPTDADRAEAGHVLPGVGRGGYQPFNIINVCRACNLWMGDSDMTDKMDKWALPTAYVTEVPKPGQVTTTGDEWDARDKARKARGM
jgi:hypothetical protein